MLHSLRQSPLGELEIETSVPAESLDVLRIELYRASKLTLSDGPVPGIGQGGGSQSAVCFRERWIQCHRASSGFRGLRHGLPRNCEAGYRARKYTAWVPP